jgi:hypothetical protein
VGRIAPTGPEPLAATSIDVAFAGLDLMSALDELEDD